MAMQRHASSTRSPGQSVALCCAMEVSGASNREQAWSAKVGVCQAQCQA